MLIVLPPSETKAHGGAGPALSPGTLSFPELDDTRRELIDDLCSLPVDDALDVLGLSERQRSEAELNLELRTAPTTPAIRRYTGVLYDALDPATLPDTSRLAVGSALFGLLRAEDPIPHYRLSGGSKLGGRTMKSRWGKQITEALVGLDELIVDLRSGPYQTLGRVPGAVTVRVVSGETRKVVSHFNKHYKGELARVLASHDAADIDEVIEIARDAGLDIEHDGGPELTLVTP